MGAAWTMAARIVILSGSKGGLYRWQHLAGADGIVLVEGIFDVAALWQAGFCAVTCGGGART